MIRCMGCMEEYSEEFEVCPYCGYIRGTAANEPYHMQPGGILHKRYIMGKVLGFGGFGVTYLGWDASLDRKVAIKEYLPSEFSTRMPGHTELSIYAGERLEQFESGRDKFIDEAKRLAKFNEIPGVVKVYDTFLENNTAYIIMEYLEGSTLKSAMNQHGKYTVDETLEIMIPVLETLKVVHAEGIIHRDIAPDNIFLTNDGEVKILDFGAARFATTKHSKSLSVILKPGYSPQEQYRSRGDQGPWTDVYSVAATMYKMLTGVTPTDAMERSVKDDLKEPSKMGVKINKSLENAILNALNTTVEGRTQSADAFLEDLRAEEVKRIKIRNKKMDVGKWPLWAKISSVAACTTIISFITLVATGIISFNIQLTGSNYVPAGKARVPNVLNMTLEEATEKCEKGKLIVQVVGKEYSDVVEEGHVMAQTAVGGSLTDENDTLGIVISAGIEKTEVPDLFGYKEEKATEILQESGLEYTVTESAHIVAEGAISLQDIEAETELETGTTLQLGKSLGMAYNQSLETTVPLVVGLEEHNAAEILSNNGLYLLKVDMVYDDTVEKYHVISQSIETDTQLMQGSIVEVVVSLGNEDVKVPDVQYKNVDEAISLLEAKNLIVVVEYEDNDVVSKDCVIRQSVESGTIVPGKTEIIIYISNGREDARELTVEDAVITDSVQQEYDNSVNNLPPIAFNASGTQKVTVPNVVGKTEAEANELLQQMNLKVTVGYKHDTTKTTGTVLSQSLLAGSEQNTGSSIMLIVCDNSKKTQYATRTVAIETTESSSNSLDGWELYDTTMTWQEYGAWSEWSTNSVARSDSRDVETRTLYRSRSLETKTITSNTSTGTEAGWDCISSIKNVGSWQTVNNATSLPSSSANTEVEKLSESITYNYYHWCTDLGNTKRDVDSIRVNSTSEKHTYSTTTPLPKYQDTFADRGGRGSEIYGSRTMTPSHACENDIHFWWLESKVTYYSYRTRTINYTNTLQRWSSWSDWSTTAISANGSTQVETSTQYRYRDRSPIYTYHFRRTVYGAFSDWSDTKPQEQEGIEITTREVYVY